MEWYLAVLKKYAVFDGRARRKEYWYFHLFASLTVVALFMIGLAVGTAVTDTSSDRFDLFVGLPLILYGLALIIPSIAVSVRRLHDIGFSGWWYLISFVPGGSVVLFIFSLMDSKPGTNQYGPDPKAAERTPQVTPPAATQSPG
jgi:uncharacterized membrane protein YhaH (DUF805 family)